MRSYDIPVGSQESDISRSNSCLMCNCGPVVKLFSANKAFRIVFRHASFFLPMVIVYNVK
jgi:hypothetical protein